MSSRRGGGSAFPRDGQNMNPRKGGQDGGHDRGGRFSQRRGGRGGTRGYYHQDGTDSRSVEQGSTLLPQPQNDQKGSWESLLKTLLAMDGQQYGYYKRLQNQWYLHDLPFRLEFDHVQGDAYAPPSRVRVRVPYEVSSFPKEWMQTSLRRVALADYISRVAAAIVKNNAYDQVPGSSNSSWSGPKGGTFRVEGPGQAVLLRSSCIIKQLHEGPYKATIELRITVNLPARGRTIMGKEAADIFDSRIPKLVAESMMYSSHSPEALRKHIECVEDQEHLRSLLREEELVAFIADGSVLPRATGATSLPMTGGGVVPFQSPPQLRVTLNRLNGGPITGMGVPMGVTMLTGGGFHGKSTLLQALEQGVYNNIPGDGREYVVTDPSAFKIRAEDGRSVVGTNISPFINQLPWARDSRAFHTDDASGSTSMAANIQEALEFGCKTLLIDEDSSATNLLVRDQRMQRLIKHEPITPLVTKVRALSKEHKVSTIIVIGGLGDWLNVADTVIGMESYVPRLLDAEANEIVRLYPSNFHEEHHYEFPLPRTLALPASLKANSKQGPFAKTKSFIALPDSGEQRSASDAQSGIDISGLDQQVETGQTRMIALCLQLMASGRFGGRSLSRILADIDLMVKEDSGLDNLDIETRHLGDVVYARPLEVGAAISRLRGLRLA